MYDNDESAVSYVANKHKTAVLDLTAKSVALGEEAVLNDMGESSTHNKEGDVSAEDSAEMIKESPPPPR